ncbi:MAG: FAD-binding protein [Pseudohongiellaceae bacterium]
MTFSGWGRYPRLESRLIEPISTFEIEKSLGGSGQWGPSIIARGAGRSYGDSALAETLVSTRYLDNFSSLTTSELGHTVLRCASGMSLEKVLETIIPKGLFLPVLPGAKAVTVGGAIAADVHGKNHHIDGSFCDHVESMQVLLATGEIINCNRNAYSELFHATCGGMGLTGIILDAAIKLVPMPSLDIAQRTLVADNLQDCMELMDEHHESKYSVAWIDCLASGAAQGRSVLYLGEHVDEKDAREKSKSGRKGLRAIKRSELKIPFDAPSFLLNKYTMMGFNSAYYALQKNRIAPKRIDYDAFFFPLERLRNWNRLYGSKGFLQYQLAVPPESAYACVSAVLSCASQAGKGSFLSVLKKFGKANNNLLSFPIEGYTLALDFKYEDSLFPLLDKLDAIVLAHGGRLYLAKDARMSKACFRQSYAQWERFAELKQKLDPRGQFSSLQSRRLGLG